MFTPNNIDFPICVWASHWAGAIVSPANPGYSVDELAFQLKDSGAKALVTQWSVIDTARAAANKVGLPQDRIVLIGDQKDPSGKVKHFTSIRNTSGTNRFRRANVDPEKDLAFLVYSSGTTGLPKGVMLCHRNIVAVRLLSMSSYKP
jgi:4-coumarate--CoA ligase